LYKLSKKYNLRYSRYADDITFSSNRNVFQKGEEFQQELETIITGQQFVINEKKTRLQKKNERQEVTGLVVSDRVNVTREYIRGLDNLLYIWEKHGEADAYAKFLAHYTPKQNLHNHKPNMQAVIQGKLHYLKMVKGADNEVWRRLQRRFNKLSGAKPSLETAWIKYKYTISDFEKKIGVKLAFDPDDNGLLHCSFTLNGKRTPVALSRYARTRVTNILSKDDLSLLERFKNSYLIIIYEWGEDCLWRIERKRRQVKQEPAHDIDKVSIIDDIAALTSQGDDVAPEQNESGKNTDEILAALVASDFDLNTLDEWDKIKSS